MVSLTHTYKHTDGGQHISLVFFIHYVNVYMQVLLFTGRYFIEISISEKLSQWLNVILTSKISLGDTKKF